MERLRGKGSSFSSNPTEIFRASRHVLSRWRNEISVLWCFLAGGDLEKKTKTHCVWLDYRKAAINSLCFAHEWSPGAAGESSRSSFHANVTFHTQPTLDTPMKSPLRVLCRCCIVPVLELYLERIFSVLELASLWPELCAWGIWERERFCWGYNILLGLCLNVFDMRAVLTL